LTYNLLHYDPIQGYDGEAHHAYVQNFLNMFGPNKTSQPGSNFTYEFFSPPLPYILPVFINEICKYYSSSENYLEYCQDVYGFLNIIFLSIIFIGLLFIYMKIIKKVLKLEKLQNVSILLLLGLFSINYKAISMIRAEIYVIFLSAILIYRLLVLAEKSFIYELNDLVIFGLLIGLLALSRQWAFLLFPGYFLLIFFIEKDFRKSFLKFLTYSFLIGFSISSWFYFGLFLDYGSFTSFNMESKGFSFKNFSSSFFFLSTEGQAYFFTKPIRPYFENSFLPILYSDLWGDYWGYFSFTSRSLDIGRNQLLIGDYLGKVNVISLFPMTLLLLGLKNSIKAFKNKQKSSLEILNIYIVFSIIFSFLGYLWFLVSYPEITGDTTKSVYMIQLFHLLGLGAIIYIEQIKKKEIKVFYVIQVALLTVFLHNFQTMLSHFPKIDIF